MSLVRTLAKVAIGVAVAKGVKSMSSGRNDGVGRGPRPGELGGLGGLLGGGGRGGSPLGGMLSQMMGGGQGAPNAGAGHRMGGGAGARPGGGGLLDQFGGSGGIGSMLGGALSGGTQTGSGASGGLGGLLQQLGGGRSMGGAAAAGAGAGGLGALLNQALQGGGTEPEQTPTAEQEDAAGVLLAAMIQAAKADGRIDDEERSRILEQVGDATPEEVAFVRSEMERDVDARALAARVPRGLEAQAYLMSLLAIDVDTPEEARYLQELREALGLDAGEARRIEETLGT